MPSWKPLEAGEIAIVQVSDLHLGATNTEEVWRQVLEFIKARVKPALIVVTGDVVDRPSPWLIKRAAEKFQAMRESLGVEYFGVGGEPRPLL